MRRDLPVTQFEGRPGVLDLGWGHPNPALLPAEPWLEATRMASTAFGWQYLAYGHAAGPGPLVEWLTGHLCELEGGDGEDGTLFVTAGASHALWLVGTVLAEAGDVVLVDSPTYHFALRILRDRGVDLVRAPCDEVGIDSAALEPVLTSLRRQGRRVAMLYLVPTFGNPTGRCLPDDRRRDLVRIAQRTGLTLVEDDTYREIHYEERAPASLWRLAGGHPVIRIGSFSKTVAPGLRLGWINADPRVVHALTNLGYVDSGGGVNHSVALGMAVFGTSGAYRRHVQHVRQVYRKQRDVLVSELRTAAPELLVPSPGGGWFLWIRLPRGCSAAALLPLAERHGVSFIEGTSFYPDASGGHGHLRASFSLLPPAELAEAARRLGGALSVLMDSSSRRRAIPDAGG